MTDIVILLIGTGCVAVLRRPAGPVRPGARMNILDVVAGLAAAFVFVYLLWALLRPEDF